jgi:hypothetical protein
MDKRDELETVRGQARIKTCFMLDFTKKKKETCNGSCN